MAPVAAKHDAEHSFPYEVVRGMADMGLFGLPFPEEYGGMGGDYFALCLALEELGKVDQSVAITLEAEPIELSPDAAAVARFNFAQLDPGRRITLHRSDVFDAVKPVKYDVILSNPPYVPSRELRDQVRRALGQLEEHYRLVLTLYYFEEMKYTDIAEILDIPLNTVKSHIRRTLLRLRTRLEEVDGAAL